MAELHRALLALDVKGDARVLATDSRAVAGDCNEIGTTCADDLGIVSSRKVGPGLWLWEGTVGVYDRATGDVEVIYSGTLRAITSMVEAAALFAMHAPEPENPDEDRDPPGS